MDLAEVLGAAIALNLLAGVPLWAGVLITGVDVLVMMLLELRSFRLLEACVIILTLAIAVCFIYELAVSQPNMSKVMEGFLPSKDIFKDKEMVSGNEARAAC